MGVIYEPRGKAKEYCRLACNLYTGCQHGCTYCYVPATLYRDPCDFATNVLPRKQIIEKIKKEAPQHAGETILLCFTCDPYQPVEEHYMVTRRVLEIFKIARAIPVILTKGKLGIRDFDLLKECGGWYGASLTCMNPENSRKWEPGAALPEERIELLEKAKAFGIKTWVSFEPVVEPEETLRLIDEVYGFVDHVKVGKLNYHPRAAEIDWEEFYEEVMAKLRCYRMSFYIKNDLRQYAQRAKGTANRPGS